MRLVRPFIRLPLDFDADALASEIATIPEGHWRPHPQGTPGNSALPLVAVGGDPGDDATIGAMAPTPHLDALPYVRQVLAALGTVVGRSRLMRIDREAEVVPHVDTNAYWWDRARVHVPVVTDPSVHFECGGEVMHLAAGETWIFDTWRQHRVVNPADHPRVHLVVDTVGTPSFWESVDAACSDDAPRPRRVPHRLGAELQVAFESVNTTPVMSPWEVDRKVADLLSEADRCGLEVTDLRAALDRFRRGWRATWSIHGDDPVGAAAYDRVRDRLDRVLLGDEGRFRLDNGVDLVEMVRQLVLRPALVPAAQERARPRARTDGRPDVERVRVPAGGNGRPSSPLRRPIIIVSSPRSGSSLLFETLARAPHLHTVGGESHQIIESLPALHPAERGWSSNRLTADDATTEAFVHIHRNLLNNLRDRQRQRAPTDGRPVRVLEKTPKNALRIPFLADLFPDATFIYLYRDPRETISSMLDAWRSGRFVTYPDLPGWDGPPWSLLLTPGWRELIGRPLAEVVVDQWATTTDQMLDDLEALGPERWCVASYDRLVADPATEIGQLCRHLGLDWDIELSDRLPDSKHTLDSPHPDKWRRNADELESAWGPVEAVAARAHQVFADPPRTDPVRPPAAAPEDPDRPGAASRRSVHSTSVPELLRGIGASLLVSTYQSGHVIVVRDDGHAVNTHFRSFPSPMGMAVDRNLLAFGTKQGVWVYQNQPSVAARLEPPGRHDAAFMPRTHHVTGDIRVHDLAFSNDELWVVNTRFSCLATLDGVHSFVPRWRPGFVTALVPEDRCHLNGLALVDGEVRFVTALGTTDTAGGWREHKADGGVVVDVPTGEIVAAGLSMPHSPRWYRGRLWVLESGEGSIVTIDPETGDRETVAHLPGFTRGLAFAGRYAFVGLSQVREHVFGGLPLTDHLRERVCGVWVVDIEAGSIAGFLRFDGDVHEIYDVQLVGVRYPELVEPGADLASDAFVLSDDALDQVART